MRLVGVTALAFVAFLAAGVEASGSVGPSLRLTAYQPLTVKGQRFAPRERVRVEVSGSMRATRRIVTTRLGTFTVRFEHVRPSRCDLIRVVAVGGSGSRATVKLLPAPACLLD